MREALLARDHQVFAGDALLQQTDIFKEYMRDSIDEEDLEDAKIAEQFNELRHRKQEQHRREAAARAATVRLAGGGSSNGAQGSGERPTVGRRFVPVPATGYLVETARGWLPPECSLSKDTTRENRWRLRMRFLPKEITKSYGRNSDVDDYGAMVYLLMISWREWTKHSGESCPIDFAMPPPPQEHE